MEVLVGEVTQPHLPHGAVMLADVHMPLFSVRDDRRRRVRRAFTLKMAEGRTVDVAFDGGLTLAPEEETEGLWGSLRTSPLAMVFRDFEAPPGMKVSMTGSAVCVGDAIALVGVETARAPMEYAGGFREAPPTIVTAVRALFVAYGPRAERLAREWYDERAQ